MNGPPWGALQSNTGYVIRINRIYAPCGMGLAGNINLGRILKRGATGI